MEAHRTWLGRGGNSLLFHFDDVVVPLGSPVQRFGAEITRLDSQGSRWALGPRATRTDGRVQSYEVTGTWSSALMGPAGRIGCSIAAGASRGDRFRGALREVSLMFTFAPRTRERGWCEVRGSDDGSAPSFECSAVYDFGFSRFENGVALPSARDSGRVVARVVSHGAGVPDVLVSLDNREFRFTDRDGAAAFEHVVPGDHVLAIEERSLPQNWRAVSACRTALRVEADRLPLVVQFDVERLATVKQF